MLVMDLALLAAGSAAFAVAGVAALRQGRGREGYVATADGRACGKCGYTASGLPTPRCPECGNNLSAPAPIRGRLIPKLCVYCLAVVLGGYLVTRALDSLCLSTRPYSELMIRPNVAAAVPWETVQLNASGWALGRHDPPPPAGRVTFSIERADGSSASLSGVNSGGTWRVAHGDAPLDDGAIAAWLKEANVPPDDAPGRALRTILVKNLQMLLKNGSFRYEGRVSPLFAEGYSGWQTGAPPWVTNATGGVCAGVGIAGLVVLVYRTRRPAQ